MKFKDSNIPDYFQKIRKNLSNDEQYYLFLSMVANILGPIFDEQKTITDVKNLSSYIDSCSEFVGSEIIKIQLNLGNITDKYDLLNKTAKSPQNDIVNDIVKKINKSKKTKGKK